MSKVSIYFELEEILEMFKKNNTDVVEVLALIRLFETIFVAQEVFPEHSERVEFYKDMVSKVFGKEHFS